MFQETSQGSPLRRASPTAVRRLPSGVCPRHTPLGALEPSSLRLRKARSGVCLQHAERCAGGTHRSELASCEEAWLNTMAEQTALGFAVRRLERSLSLRVLIFMLTLIFVFMPILVFVSDFIFDDFYCSRKQVILLFQGSLGSRRAVDCTILCRKPSRFRLSGSCLDRP